MAGIPDSAVADVRAASDLVDVVSERVRLKKQGRRFLGLCPFHNEKSPSFSVDPVDGLYYCFGCRKGGDVFKFVEETEGVGFLDAVRLLAERAGIALPEERGGEAASRAEALHAALRFAARFYHRQLGTDAGARGKAYLRSRGFTREAVRAFGLGVAPVGWDALAEAATAEGFSADVLEAVGLVKRRASGDGVYDVFRDRLVFPIVSPIGKVLGFGGRILPDTPTASADYTPAKYINTPETEVYHKSRVLFGMKQAKAAIRAAGEAIVVEGYADVVSLWQAGVQNVVAVSGTSLTEHQINELVKLGVSRVYLMLDSDSAGISANKRSISTMLNTGLIIGVVNMPDGADPDAFARAYGGESVSNYIRDSAYGIGEYIVRASGYNKDLAGPDEKRRVVDEVVGYLSRVKDDVSRNEYIKHIARLTGVNDVDIFRKMDAEMKRGGGRSESRSPASEVHQSESFESSQAPTRQDAIQSEAVRPEEEALLRLMLRHGVPMVEYVMSRMAVEEFTEGAARTAVAALVEQFAAGTADAGPFVRGDLGDDVQALAARVLAETSAGSENWGRVGVPTPELDAKPFDTAASAMRYLKLDRVHEALEAASVRVRTAERDGLDASPIQQEIMGLHEVRREIERGTFLA